VGVSRDIPNLRIVVAVCVVAVAGYALFSVYAVVVLRDATMTGDIIGTWKSFAVAAFAFWLGSSSGGKRQDTPTGKPSPVTIIAEPGAPPQEVTVVNPPEDPVQTEDSGR
jgi:hypothetical protein